MYVNITPDDLRLILDALDPRLPESANLSKRLTEIQQEQATECAAS